MTTRPPSGTTNIFLEELAKRLKLKNFRGVFMRDELIKMTPLSQESGIMNFDLSTNPGSHWVSWYIDYKRHYYFDSFGTAVPDELRKYMNAPRVMRSDFMIQGTDTDICGELCLAFIYAMDKDKDKDYKKIISKMHQRT